MIQYSWTPNTELPILMNFPACPKWAPTRCKQGPRTPLKKGVIYNSHLKQVDAHLVGGGFKDCWFIS